jgi:hypothetical protein
MPGQIKSIIDSIIEQRARGNTTLALTTKTKLMLKGVNPDRYTSASPDDPAVISKLAQIAAEMGVQLRSGAGSGGGRY